MKTYTVKVQNTKEGLRINGNLCKMVLRNGIGVVENYSAGGGHSAHPNIDKSGSVKGMKSRGFWRKDDIIKSSGGFIYNISSVVISDDLDALAYFIEKSGQVPSLDYIKDGQFTFEI